MRRRCHDARRGLPGGRRLQPSDHRGRRADLCLRMRRKGWKVLRIDAEMALHDMAMTRFGQWWKRCMRNRPRIRRGQCHAWPNSRATLCPADAECGFLGDSHPAGSPLTRLADLGIEPWALGRLSVLILANPSLLRSPCGWSLPDAKLYAVWIVLAKFPQAVGFIRYWIGRLAGKRSLVIEHRGSVPRG